MKAEQATPQIDTDYLAWYIVFGRDRWEPPTETALNCIEALETDDEATKAHERGYHSGAFVALDELELFCERTLDWDIRKAARRYADREGLTVPDAERRFTGDNK